MKKSCHRGWLIFLCCFVLAFFAITVAHSVTIDLIGFVSFALVNGDAGHPPLADGSVIMIFGSVDDINSGPVTVGGTNLIADSTQGDDVYIGLVRIDSAGPYGAGTFYTAYEFAFDEYAYNWLYIRFFNTTISPVEGYHQWGTSDLFNVESNTDFGKVTIDFAGNYSVITNNFVVIPEPRTGHLLLLFFGLVFGVRASMKKAERAPPACLKGDNP